MDSHNVLQQKIKAPFISGPEPGASGTIAWDRDEQVVELKPASGAAETRSLIGPTKSGLKIRLDCTTFVTSSDCTVTVYNAANASTGTIAFSAAGQWAKLESFENASGVVEWRVMASYGCTITTVPQVATTANSTSSNLTTPVVIGGLTASGSGANNFSGSTGTFLTSTGATTIGGRATFSKSVLRPVQSALTATAAAAAAITADKDIVLLLSVTTATTYGWTLPTGVAGMVLTLINTAAYANTLKPASGGTINGLAGDATVVIAASKCYIAVCSAADTWHVLEAAKATAT